jgi:hypothetical protein
MDGGRGGPLAPCLRRPLDDVMSACLRIAIALFTGTCLALRGGSVAADSTNGAAVVETRLGDYRIAHWTMAQGLPQNSVNDIVRLPNGELWVATFGGLARFDGERFRVMDMASDEGLPTHRIVALAVAGPDAFWFLTQQGHLGRVERGVATELGVVRNMDAWYEAFGVKAGDQL